MSKVSELKALQKLIEDQQKRALELQQELDGLGEICEYVRTEAGKRNISVYEVIYALAPELEKKSGKADNAEPKQTRNRKTKRYVNPHTQETYDSKGGNSTLLKQWREKYGSDEVDSWATIID